MKLHYYFILLLLSSCYNPTHLQSFHDFNKLEGDWESITNIRFNETWTIVSDTLMIGFGYSIQNKDTVFKENLKLYLYNEELYYAALVGKSEKYISFKLNDSGKDYWIFKNEVHDYPNIISYRFKEPQLIATTTNMDGNKKIEFVFKRKGE